MQVAARAWIADWRRPSGAPDAIDTALRLTLVMVLLRPMGPWFVRAFLLLLATLGLIAPAVMRAPATWLALSWLVAARLVVDWPLPDNHIYLLAYWCLAAALALREHAPHAALARSGRLLMGLAFLFAVLWKGVLSPDYVDGRFFRVTLAIDDRFADVVRLAGGLSDADVQARHDYLTPLPGGAALLDPPPFPEPRGVRWLAAAATWGGLLLEGAIALLCLWPRDRPGVARLRHVAILTFCLATYALAPVAGFGWLLLAMGLAGCRDEDRLWRWCYVAAWLTVGLYAEVPWATLLVDVLG